MDSVEPVVSRVQLELAASPETRAVRAAAAALDSPETAAWPGLTACLAATVPPAAWDRRERAASPASRGRPGWSERRDVEVVMGRWASVESAEKQGCREAPGAPDRPGRRDCMVGTGSRAHRAARETRASSDAEEARASEVPTDDRDNEVATLHYLLTVHGGVCETVQCPSVCLSVTLAHCSSVRRVYCCGPGGWPISIDCCTAGAAAARRSAVNAGSATFTADVGS